LEAIGQLEEWCSAKALLEGNEAIAAESTIPGPRERRQENDPARLLTNHD